jgi:hypothetical protein
MAGVKGRSGPRHGIAKRGGRKKGTPNRKTFDAVEVINRLGVDPIAEMIKLAKAKNTSPELKGRMWSEVASYIYPKRKALEVTGESGGAIQVQLTYTDKPVNGHA